MACAATYAVAPRNHLSVQALPPIQQGIMERRGVRSVPLMDRMRIDPNLTPGEEEAILFDAFQDYIRAIFDDRDSGSAKRLPGGQFNGQIAAVGLRRECGNVAIRLGLKYEELHSPLASIGRVIWRCRFQRKKNVRERVSTGYQRWFHDPRSRSVSEAIVARAWFVTR